MKSQITDSRKYTMHFESVKNLLFFEGQCFDLCIRNFFFDIGEVLLTKGQDLVHLSHLNYQQQNTFHMHTIAYKIRIRIFYFLINRLLYFTDDSTEHVTYLDFEDDSSFNPYLHHCILRILR